jgi:Mg-chelatase subunit ChlI
MFKKEVERRSLGGKYAPKTTVDISELEALDKYIDQVEIPDRVLTVLMDLERALTNMGIVTSDRRDNARLKVLQANAALNGRNKVSTKDMMALLYMLWQKESDIPKIRQEITKLVSPWDAAIKDQMDRVQKVKDEIEAQRDASNNPDPVRRRKAILTGKPHLEGAMKQLQALSVEMASEGEATGKVQRDIKGIDKLVQGYMKEALGYDPNLTPTKGKANKPDTTGTATPDEDLDMPF